MTEGDGFFRITLRIPAELHAKLNDATGKKRSMNAEIIDRLESTFTSPIAPTDTIPSDVIRMTASEASITTAALIMDAMEGISGTAAAKDFRTRLKESLRGHLERIKTAAPEDTP